MSGFFTLLPLCSDGRFVAPPGRFDTIEEARSAAAALAATQPVAAGFGIMECVEIVPGEVSDYEPAEDPEPESPEEIATAARIAAFSAALAARLAGP